MRRARGIPRREFLRAAGIGGAGLLLASALPGCDSREDVDELRWLNWQDYIDPETIPLFEGETGISVVYETYESNDELEQKLIQASRPRRGGRTPSSYDLMVPSDNFVNRFRRLDLIQELDHSSLTGLDNLRADLRNASFDPDNRYSVPWATGTTGIGYDTSEFPEPPNYDVFLNTEYADRMTILNEVRDAFGLALLSIGRDPNTRSQQDINEATTQLIQMREVIRGFDSSNYLDDLVEGRLVVAQAYSSDVVQAKRLNPSLEFTIPESGGLRWVDALAIPADAAHEENALQFISAFLTPETSARV